MKYMLALIGDESGWDDVTDEEMRAMMEPWDEFEQQLADAGVKLAGEGLQPSATATTVKVGEGEDRVVTDGPFAETKEQLGGFYLLECDDLDAALEWAKRVPLEPGGSVEVRPVMDYAQYGFEEPEARVEGSS
ncbi:MAG: YciI family protein [Solirubrobacterales bacterium]